MGHGAWALGMGKVKSREKLSTLHYLLPPTCYSQCPMPNAQCPMPITYCPMPNSQFPIPRYMSVTRKWSAKKQRAIEVLIRLKRLYPDARCTLDYETPVQLLVATILSAQCTDERVNKVTPALFARFPDAAALSEAPPC